MSAEEVSRAVSALYGADARQQADANQWLIAFAETPAAWEVCRELVVGSPEPMVRFFGANVLHGKVRKEWHALPEDGKAGAFGALHELVLDATRREQPLDMLVPKRLCLALGAAAAQQASVCGRFVETALRLGAVENGAQGAFVAFCLLSSLPDEMEELMKAGGRVAGAGQRPSHTDLLVFVPAVSRLAETHLVTAPPTGPLAVTTRKAALACLRTWIAMAPSALSLRELARTWQGLLEALLLALSEDATAETAADALCEACSLDVVSLSTEPEDVVLASSMAAGLLRLRPRLAQAAAVGDDDWASAFTRALGHFATCAARTLACASGGQGAEAQQLQQLIVLTLECMSYPSYRVADNLVDVWVSLQDIPMAERAEQMRAPLFERLLQLTLERCMWPVGDDGAVDEDVEDGDFDKWRHQSASEVITSCLGALGGTRFVSTLASLLPRQPPATPGEWAGSWRRVEVVAYAMSAVHVEVKQRLRSDSPPAAPPTTPTGDGSPVGSRVTDRESLANEKAQIDSTLVAVFRLAHAIPRMAVAATGGGGTNGRDSADVLGGGVAAALGAALPVDWHLLPTLSATVGNFGQWLKSHADVIEPTIEFALFVAAARVPCPGGGTTLSAALASAGRTVPAGAVEAPRVQLAGGEAFRNVCVHCAGHLSSSSLVLMLVHATKPLLSSGARIVVGDGSPLGTDARVPLVEGMGRLVAVLGASDTDGATAALTGLVAAPASALHTLLQQVETASASGTASRTPPELSHAIALELALISSAIRFCDADSNRLTRLSGVAGAQAPNPATALIRVIGDLWPLLEQVPSRCPGDVGAADALLDVLTKAIICAKGFLSPQLPQVLDLALHAFLRTRALGALQLVKVTAEVHGQGLDLGSGAGVSSRLTAPPQVRDALLSVLGALTDAVCAPVLATLDVLEAAADGASTGAADTSGEAEPQLLHDYFEMVHRVLVFCAPLLFALPAEDVSPGSLGQLLLASARCVTHQEFTHTRTVISTLCQLLERAADSSGARHDTAARALSAHGSKLMASCILGLVSLSPEVLMDHQCELLRVLFESWPHQAPHWLQLALQVERVKVASAHVAQEGIQLFLHLMAHQPALEHADIGREFAHMCRRKTSMDGLRQFVPAMM